MLRQPRLLHVLRQSPPSSTFHAPPPRILLRQLQTLPTWRTTPQRNLATHNASLTRNIRAKRSWQTPPSPNRHHTRPNSTNRDPLHDAATPRSLSDRMKAMSKKYGWVVVGIYLGLSVLDFPFCFLAVRWFGTERIAEAEEYVMRSFWRLAERVVPSLQTRREQKEALETQANEATREGEGGGVLDVERRHEEPSIWTQLLLAYGVHKSLIFIRIPITVAITPKVVKTLRGWGWKIGKTPPSPKA